MILTIDTSQPLSLTDRTVLAALLNGGTPTTFTNATTMTVTLPAEGVEQPKAEEPKAAKPRKATAKPKAEPDPEDSSPMAQAVERASALISANQADVVRAALKVAGAPRVGELTDDQVAAFLSALDAA